MITLTPVLERWYAQCPFWPVEPSEFYLTVPRRPTPRQVGVVGWTLIAGTLTADDLSMTATRAAEAIDEYLARGHDDDSGDDFAQDGLRLEADGVVIDPGCCIGLDEWRDWLRVAGGSVIDLGHDPAPLIEHRGPAVRVWADGGLLPAGAGIEPDLAHVDIPRGALPELLDAVQRDLAGFLAAVRPWAVGIRADLADPLVTELDRRLQINPPLGGA